MARMRHSGDSYQFDIELTSVRHPTVEIDSLEYPWQWIEPREIPLALAHPERHSRLMQELSVSKGIQIEIQDGAMSFALEGEVVARNDPQKNLMFVFRWQSCDWTEDGNLILSASMNAINGSRVRQLVYRGRTYV